ncbi:flagellar motor protein B [Chania multitudinisentens RB-25]|uniref:Flagellar motor protein B n=1 Tax=Chania multitudinisentens RB-25 TaxID=1441930 RepID=W0LCJ3_9GAMM|nr:putative lateral flagellar export/assembly protein LafU [Chania multitudinisentens]AHG19690.1 flagellar motor protein B [Chania multitudinisentens RB-25]
MVRGHTKEHTTIIKRSARKGHDAIHGGAWKVAFADFTLALMALFMVLWIMGSVTEAERQQVVMTLRGENIFTGHTPRPITQPDKSGKIAVLKNDDRAKKSDADSTKQNAANNTLTKLEEQAKKNESLEEVNLRSRKEIEELARVIMKITSAYDAQSNLHLEIVPQGLRILITDDKEREMFQRSSSTLTPFFNRLLSEFAPALNKIDNKITITGHTDATRFRDQDRYDNWDLSGQRAMQARRVLTNNGLDPEQILQVGGMADKVLFTPEQPLGSANRRIEIMVLTNAASESLYQYFGHHGEKIIEPLAEKIPSSN